MNKTKWELEQMWFVTGPVLLLHGDLLVGEILRTQVWDSDKCYEKIILDKAKTRTEAGKRYRPV